MLNAPVLLTRPNAVSPWMTQALTDLPLIVDSYVLGGAAVVSDSVMGTLPSPTRLWGADRYETAQAVCDEAAGLPGFSSRYIYLATGTSFPDALAAGPLAAASATPRSGPCPLLLVRPDSLPAPTGGFISTYAEDCQTVRVIGGSGAVSDDVLQQVEDAF